MPNATDRRRATLFRRRGITFQNQASAIDEIERIVGDERIDCDFTGSMAICSRRLMSLPTNSKQN